MNKLLIIILAGIILCSCHSITGSGNIKTETRNVGTFDKINAIGSIDIELTDDNNSAVRVEADDNILQYIITDVRSGTLEVRFKSNMIFNNTHAKVFVAANGIKKLTVTGSADIVSKDTLKSTDEIGMEVTGSGDITALVDAPSVNAEILGSGSISLSGRTKNLNCDGSGSGDFKCKNLLSENTTADVSGSGSAHVFASVHLKASVSGSGDIYYSGNAPSPETHISGSGSIQPEK